MNKSYKNYVGILLSLFGSICSGPRMTGYMLAKHVIKGPFLDCLFILGMQTQCDQEEPVRMNFVSRGGGEAEKFLCSICTHRPCNYTQVVRSSL
jgi:hypothetical protein